MRYNLLVFGFTLFASGLCIYDAHAVTPLSGSEFRRLCGIFAEQPYSQAGISCSTYIHGFLGGAHASGKSRDSATDDGEPKRSEFTERATRTRVARRVDRYGNYHAAGYCVPANETLVGAIDSVINYLNTKKADENETANQLVLQALKNAYPCAKD